MAVFRERPYGQFNFRVEIEGGPASDTVKGGFQEVSGLGLEVTVAEYRNGNMRENAPIKITGMYKVPDVTLKRGVIGDLDFLYAWLKEVRDGNQNMLKKVRVILQSEAHEDVQEWQLTNARPTKYTGPSLTAKGADVAVDELVLTCEKIDLV